MTATRVFVTGFGVVLCLGALVTACGDDGAADPSDAGADAPFIDAGRGDGGEDEESEDADGGTADTGPVIPDTTPPERVTDLAATPASHASVKLTWTAPEDDSGSLASYELRYATTAITTLAEFLAATSATAPSALAPGASQTATVSGLTPETEYHFAIRARDPAGNFSDVSNDVAATTKARAAFLISEIAPLNTAEEGGDFVELVATKAGSAADIEIRHSTAAVSALLHKLAPLDVVAGDRVVVHVVGQGLTGIAQEDVTNDKTSSTETFASAGAFDVYSAVSSGLVNTNSLISVMDGATYMDAAPYSARAANASAAAMTALANAHAAGAWTFTTAPVDGADDCPTLLEVLNASGNSSPTGCGGFPGYLEKGRSLQRNGVVDTNSRADFSSAPQTRGAENAPFCPPESARVAFTEINPRANLVELTVVEGGRLRDFNVRTNPNGAGPSTGSAVFSFPDFCPATGDVVVVHLGSNATPNETTSKNQHLNADYPTYYDSAWDFATNNTISYATTVVVAVRTPTNVWVDAAAFTQGSGTPSGTLLTSLQFMQSIGRWLPADCGGAPCANDTTPTAREVAANWLGLPTTSDMSMSRSPAAAAQASSWTLGASTFGQ
ncbi:MAG: fibronectin type III domain-containing protein [Labilithrix sp.]|nr:fibronectin type III domain-containing protein [Labilithrix sp.]MBX3223626.1 fibronectin type III domain-containing protein [Labilithrix sp.]